MAAMGALERFEHGVGPEPKAYLGNVPSQVPFADLLLNLERDHEPKEVSGG